MNGQEVQRVGKGQKQETYKYLGVLIGEDLTFDEHINRVRGKSKLLRKFQGDRKKTLGAFD